MIENPAEAAVRLREAYGLVEQFFPEGGDRANVLRRLARMIEALDGPEVRTCRQCGATFTFSRAEALDFRTRGLVLPQRCRACRDARRHAQT